MNRSGNDNLKTNLLQKERHVFFLETLSWGSLSIPPLLICHGVVTAFPCWITIEDSTPQKNLKLCECIFFIFIHWAPHTRLPSCWSLLLCWSGTRSPQSWTMSGIRPQSALQRLTPGSQSEGVGQECMGSSPVFSYSRWLKLRWSLGTILSHRHHIVRQAILNTTPSACPWPS